MSRRVRIGVVGGGLVAQAVHLPLLARLGDLFELRAIAEPSSNRRLRLQSRFQVPGAYHDWREMIEGERLHALVVCSPNGTHADVAAGALEAGLHALVEKPLCITQADAERLIQLRDRVGCVLQVGYMKRHDPACERLIDELPSDASTLRLVHAVTHDPQLRLQFRRDEIDGDADLPDGFAHELAKHEHAQIESAVGMCTPSEARVYSDVFLGALIHDVNLVHAALAAMGEAFPTKPIAAGWWAGGAGASVTFEGSKDSRCSVTWIQLSSGAGFREEMHLYFEEDVRQLRFPAPYSPISHTPTRYVRRNSGAVGLTGVTFEGYDDCFENELRHFHACIASRAECLNPAEEAALDQRLLTEAFKLARGAPTPGANAAISPTGPDLATLPER